LCSECFKSCPEDNIGLFLQKPLTSVVAPVRRRADVAWAVALLWGLVVYQQANATNVFASVDSWFNTRLGFPHYPDPVDYAGFIVLAALALAGAARGLAAVFARRDIELVRSGSFADRSSRFRAFFVPVAYGLIPVMGADYFARQLPKFFKHAARVVPAVQHVAGFRGRARRSTRPTSLPTPRSSSSRSRSSRSALWPRSGPRGGSAAASSSR
jgi:hypothetical protein